MDPDFVFFVSYSCPRCHAALEARSSGPPSWLRCPACGRASLPPEHNRQGPSTFVDDKPLLIGESSTPAAVAALPIRPRRMAPRPSTEGSKARTSRVLLGAGMFLATSLFLFSLLDSNLRMAIFFGFVAIVCLVLLTRKPGHPMGD